MKNRSEFCYLFLLGALSLVMFNLRQVEAETITVHLGDATLRSLSDDTEDLLVLSQRVGEASNRDEHKDFEEQIREQDYPPNTDAHELDRPRGQESPRALKYGRYCMNGHERAGNPLCIGKFAKPSINSDYSVGYVGGGSIFPGDRRLPSEGTFGMDYSGHWFSRKTWLHWTHGRRTQGGDGAYASEGPKLLE